MKTSTQREEDFREDLEALLKKHGAELSVTDDGKPYGMHSAIAVVSMESIYDADGNRVEDFAEFRL